MQRGRTACIISAWSGIVVTLFAAGRGGSPTTFASLVGLLALAITLGTCAAFAGGRLLQQPCLLVPPAIAFGVETIVGAVAGSLHAEPVPRPRMEALLDAGASDSMAAVLVLVAGMVLWSLHAAWLTPMIVEVARGRSARDVLIPTLLEAPHRLGRSVLLLALGHAPRLLFVGAIVLASGVGPPVLVAAMIALFVAAVLWNLASATLLLQALPAPGPLSPAIRTALRTGWWRQRLWRGPVLAQVFVTGLVVVLPGNVIVSGRWLGGYEAGSCWLEVAERSGAAWGPLAPVLGLATMALAITIKLRIAGKLHESSSLA